MSAPQQPPHGKEAKAGKSRAVPQLLLYPYAWLFPWGSLLLRASDASKIWSKCVKKSNREGEHRPRWKGWRLSEVQHLFIQQEATAAVALPTNKPSHQHKSEVEVLEMAAVLIKQIYSIDINSCFTTAVPRWKRCPTPPGKGSRPLPRTCSSQIPRASAEPAAVLGERVSSAADSSEQRALQNRDSALFVFQKTLRNLKTHQKILAVWAWLMSLELLRFWP